MGIAQWMTGEGAEMLQEQLLELRAENSRLSSELAEAKTVLDERTAMMLKEAKRADAAEEERDALRIALGELEDAGIENRSAIFTLCGTPREGYTLEQEILAQLEETQADRDDLKALGKKLADALDTLWRETCQSGNALASDFGWPEAREKALTALSEAKALGVGKE